LLNLLNKNIKTLNRMEIKKIFYNINPKKLRKFNFQDKDIGIFFDERKDFIGKQFIMKIVKPINYYNYEEIIQEFYKKNKEAFTIRNKNISFMCNKFLLRTYNSFGRNSIGNYMTLIDILDMIFKDIGKDKFIEFYIPAKEKDIEYVIKEFFEENKIERFKIIKIKQLTFSGNISDTIISKGGLVRLFLRYLLKRRFKKLSSSITNLFIEPISSEMDTFSEVRKMIENYDVLTFELKNEIKTLRSIFDLIKHKEKPFIGEFYNLEHFIELWKAHKEIIKKVRNLNLVGLIYKNIDLISPSKAILNSLFSGYYLLIIDSLMLSERICSKCKNVFFHYNDDPFLEALSINDNKYCKKYSIQYELIYPGCVYNILKKPEELKTEYELVWNEYSRKILVNYYGYSPEKVKVIGNVRFSKIAKKESEEKINIVLVTPGAVYPEILDFFLNSINDIKNDNLQFYIK